MFGIKSKVLIRTITLDDKNGSHSSSGPTQNPKGAIPNHLYSTHPTPTPPQISSQAKIPTQLQPLSPHLSYTPCRYTSHPSHTKFTHPTPPHPLNTLPSPALIQTSPYPTIPYHTTPPHPIIDTTPKHPTPLQPPPKPNLSHHTH